MHIEHALLFRASWLAVLVVAVLLGWPVPLVHLREGGPRGRRRAALHALVLLAGVGLWLRWLVAFDLVERHDALFAALLIVGCGMALLRCPWRGASCTTWIAGSLVKRQVRRHPRARVVLDHVHAMAGLAVPQRAAARKGAPSEPPAPSWLAPALHRAGRLHAGLRQVPRPRGALLEHSLPGMLEQAALRLEHAVRGPGGIRSARALEAACEVTDLLGAWLEVRFLLGPGAAGASVATATLAPVVKLLPVLEKVDSAHEGSDLARTVRAEVLASVKGALQRVDTSQRGAGGVARLGPVRGTARSRRPSSVRDIDPAWASLPWLAALLARVAEAVPPADARPLELMRLQAERDALAAIPEHVPPAEDLARWLVAHALLGDRLRAADAGSRSSPARASYPVLALEVLRPPRRDSACRVPDGSSSALLELLEARILRRLQPEKARAPALEGDYLEGVSLLQRLRAGDPFPRARWLGAEGTE
ncbi:MAG: hypothetical protein ACKOCB_09495 [Planctomycetia bacterium]